MIIAPSIFAADIGRLSEEVKSVEEAGAQYLHIDIMDGHFVPNLSFGSNVVEGLRSKSRLVFDVHLMLEKPLRMTESFIDSGADIITVHAEIDEKIDDIYQVCMKRGIRFGIAVKPQTPVCSIIRYIPMTDLLLVMGISPGYGGQRFLPGTLMRIKEAKQLRDEFMGKYLISVDGGVNEKTTPEITKAGADMLVAGTAIFGNVNRKAAIDRLIGKAEL